MNNNKQHTRHRIHSHPYILGVVLALCYGLIVALLPTMINALEVPDPRALRDQILGDLCETVASDQCPHESGDDDDDTDEGDTGDDDDDDSTGGGSGGGSDDEEVVLTLQTQSGVVVQDERTLEAGSADDVAVQPTDGGDSVDVSAQSALALLIALDEDSDEFAITDLQYFTAYESFFLNCIAVEGEGELCGEWQYAVNGEYPSVGLDTYELEEGDSVFFFFGPSRVVQSPRVVVVGEPFQVVAQEYDPDAGKYQPVSGYTIGIVRDDPDDPLVPIEVETLVANEAGEATFTLAVVGEYGVGIQEDYYYPTKQLSVVATIDDLPGGSSGGGGGGGLIDEIDEFDVRKALLFIEAQQEENGSFGAPIFTDWATLALVAGGADTEKVHEYLVEDVGVYESVTDHERRAMALMALGVSPYDGTETDHIEAILSFFGGMQIGDPALVNDDIFALVVLHAAGYGEEDEVIQSVVSFLVDEQAANGAWGADVDLTAAGVQALVPFEVLEGVDTALFKAKAYLRVQQDNDGGFGNSFSTSWVLQALAILEEGVEDWEKKGTDPLTYLATQQESDGGVEREGVAEETRLWATSYAVPAALGLSWHDIMHAFERPESESTISTTGGSVRRDDNEVEVTVETGPVASSSTGTSTEASPAGDGVVVDGMPSVGADTVQRTDSDVLPAASFEPPVVELEADESHMTATGTASLASSTDEQLASVAEVGGDATFTALRALALIFAAALIGFGVFKWRKV